MQYLEAHQKRGSMEDRRSSFRTGVHWPVTIITSEGSTEGEVTNASGRGAFIHCEKPLEAGKECVLIMRLSESQVAEIAAEVVWSSASGLDDDAGPPGMGVRFLL